MNLYWPVYKTLESETLSLARCNEKLPPDFESDLQTIAERLYSNHAVVMVWAGFSRNASESYRDWNGLGDLFYALLYRE